MSSDDSDSDVCDFMTDAGSKLGKDKFWKKFKLTEDEDNKITPEPKDTVDISPEDTEKSPKTSLEKAIETNSPTNLSNSPTNSPNSLTNSSKLKNKIDEFADINIENKLETLSKKVKEILAASSKPTRGTRGRARGRRKTRQIQLPYTKIVTAAPVEKSPAMTFPLPGLQSSHGPIRSTRSRRSRNRSQNVSTPTAIVLSDDETSNKSTKTPEELNPIVPVKVLWKSAKIQTFQIKKYQTFEMIKDYYVKEKNANPKLLFFMLNNKEIDLETCSVVSLQLKEGDVIEGGTLSESYLEEKSAGSVQETGLLKLKVQFNARRSNMFSVSCRKSDKMEVVFWQVMQEVEEPIEKLKIYFDGELLSPGQEIASLDLEDGDCFDLIVGQN